MSLRPSIFIGQNNTTNNKKDKNDDSILDDKIDETLIKEISKRSHRSGRD